VLFSNEAGVYMSDKMICGCGTMGKWASDTWFPGIVYRNMLKEFKSFYFFSDRQLQIIAHKWLSINLKFIVAECVCLSIHGFDKRFVICLFDDYYNLAFSLTQRFVLLPVCIFFKFMIRHSKLLDRLMKFHKRYDEMKDRIININY
jgi:hypothetical protein